MAKDRPLLRLVEEGGTRYSDLLQRYTPQHPVLHCNLCDTPVVSRQSAVAHAKRHEVADEAHLIPGRRMQPIEDRYEIAPGVRRKLSERASKGGAE